MYCSAVPIRHSDCPPRRAVCSDAVAPGARTDAAPPVESNARARSLPVPLRHDLNSPMELPDISRHSVQQVAAVPRQWRPNRSSGVDEASMPWVSQAQIESNCGCPTRSPSTRRPGNCSPRGARASAWWLDITWNSGLWLRLRSGCSASTNCSNGKSWCAWACRAVLTCCNSWAKDICPSISALSTWC